MNRRKFLKAAVSGAVMLVLPVPEFAFGNTPIVGHDADFVSFDLDGFTVNWPEAATGVRIVTFIASLGTEVYQGDFPKSHMTGNQSIIGVGFMPDKVLIDVAPPEDS